MKLNRTYILISLVLLAAASVVAVGGWFCLSLPQHFAPVDPGIVYRSGQGRGFQIQNAIRRNGIKTIVCLRETDSDKDKSWLTPERDASKANHVEFIHWPMSSNAPLPADKLIEFLKLSSDPERVPILVHCAQGKHRTGGFVAAYRMVVNDWSFGKAIAEMDSFGFGLGSHEEILSSLRTLDPAAVRKMLAIRTHPAAATARNIDAVFNVGMWTLFGFAGQFFFFSRFMVQWVATERKGRTHVPVAFWYLSLLGGAMLTVYAVGQQEIVFTLGQGLGCFIYIRNLMIIRRNQTASAEAETNGC